MEPTPSSQDSARSAADAAAGARAGVVTGGERLAAGAVVLAYLGQWLLAIQNGMPFWMMLRGMGEFGLFVAKTLISTPWVVLAMKKQCLLCAWFGFASMTMPLGLLLLARSCGFRGFLRGRLLWKWVLGQAVAFWSSVLVLVGLSPVQRLSEENTRFWFSVLPLFLFPLVVSALRIFFVWKHDGEARCADEQT